MIRFSVLLSLLLLFFQGFLSGSEEKEKSPLRSSVKFYEKYELKKFDNWEKDFFKFKEVPQEAPDIEIELKVQKNIEKTVDKKIIEPVKKKIEKPEPVQVKKEVPEVKISDPPVIEEIITETPSPEIVKQQTEKRIEKNEKKPDKKPVITEEKEIILPDDEENDEEQVDSSERMRKMKEMMRKKKGNRRIEDRRVY
jgi:hypothetical protein